MKFLLALSLAALIACAPSASVAPTAAQAYADAFCAKDTQFIFDHTAMYGLTQQNVEDYFSDEPPCNGVSYRGAVNDSGQERHIFVLTFSGGREDWLVFDFVGDKCTDFARG